ncbi:MAG: zinc transporter ZntB [Parvibaculaceae bacterium]|nr:zinc transporter ZntB [Parvibaculaceae bacterium]
MTTEPQDALVRRLVISANEGVVDDENQPTGIAANMIEWLHFDRSHPETRALLLTQHDIDELAVDALLADETRPRCSMFSNGVLLNFRGVNLNPGMQQDEMISLRLWVSEGRVISLRKHRIFAVHAVLSELDSQLIPKSEYHLVNRLVWHLTRKIGKSLLVLAEELDEIEESVVAAPDETLRSRLVEARRQAIVLRRYLAPQRDALTRWTELQAERGKPVEREQSRENVDSVVRYIEDLDSLRDRSAIVQDTFLALLSDRLNRNMFLLAILSAFFLPLGFFTGLLGVNVGGIPGTDWDWSFASLCIALLALCGVQAWVFSKLGWLGRRSPKLFTQTDRDQEKGT